MSIMTLGGGLGGLLVVVVAWLVEGFGWRWALRVLALAMITLGLAVATNVRARPPGHPQPIDGRRPRDWREGDPDAEAEYWGVPLGKVVRSPAFLLLAFALTLNNFGTTAFVVHQIPYLERSLHVSKAAAGSTVALFTLTSIVGRLGFGLLADHYSKRWMMAASMLLMVIGLIVLALATKFSHALVAILLIAPGFGGTIPVRPAMLADYFGTKTFGTINGVMALLQTTGGAIGPWVVGLVVDRTGVYTLGWWTSAVVVAFAIPAVLAARPPTALTAQYRPAARKPVLDVDDETLPISSGTAP
jgi:sugar phosphate permease